MKNPLFEEEEKINFWKIWFEKTALLENSLSENTFSKNELSKNKISYLLTDQMSPRHSDQMSKTSRVSWIAHKGCAVWESEIYFE